MSKIIYVWNKFLDCADYLAEKISEYPSTTLVLFAMLAIYAVLK